MSFGDAIKSFFTKYVTFSGRARRSEYWYSVLFTTLVSTVIMIIWPGSVDYIGEIAVQRASGISDLWSLAIFLPSLAITWRRLHDIGRKGTYFFFVLIPIVGIIMLIVQLAKDSQAGANVYGEPVK
jgi:uncharacterized membrane protein YhaH (DUF805 family)